MKRTLIHFILAYILCSIALTAHAEVGVRDMHFVVNKEIFDARIWYPTDPKHASVGKESSDSLLAVGDKVVDGPRLPLIILSHGTGGNRDGLAWLATALAERGALVVAANHPGSSNGASSVEVLQVWRQPQQVKAMITQLQASEWGPRIAPDKIAMIGFSIGGYTALALAGARVEMEKLVPFCAANDTGACRYIAKTLPKLDAAHFRQANADQFDPRIKAVVAISPGLGESVIPASIVALKTPTLLLTAGNDEQLPVVLQARPLARLLPSHSAYYEIKGAGHFSFLPLLNAKVCAELAEEGEGFVCYESPTKTKAQVHTEAIGVITEFLQHNKILN